MCWPQTPCQDSEVLVEQPDHRAERVHHQAACRRARLELARPPDAGRPTESSSRGVPMPLAHRMVTPARCTCSTPSASTYSAPVHQAVAAHQQALDARAVYQRHAALDGHRPVGAVDRRLGPLGAAPQAGRALHAGVQPAVRTGGDRVRPRPPVPAEVVVRAGDAAAHACSAAPAASADPRPGGNAVSPARPETPQSFSTRT